MDNYDHTGGFNLIPDNSELRERINQEATKKIIELAYAGYKVLKVHGTKAISELDKKVALIAIKRILGIMEDREEYEKCIFLHDFLKTEFQGEDIAPVFDYK